MRFLLLSSIVFLVLFTSCKSLSKTSNKEISNTLFNEVDKDFVYKAHVKISSHEFGGVIYIKKIEENFRVVFTTEMGNTIFDLTITKKGYIKHKAVVALDRKIILSIIAKDFRILTTEKVKSIKVDDVTSGLDDGVYGKIKRQKLRYNFNTDTLKSITYLKGDKRPKAIIIFEDKEIEIDHFKINYKLNLIDISN